MRFGRAWVRTAWRSLVHPDTLARRYFRFALVSTLLVSVLGNVAMLLVLYRGLDEVPRAAGETFAPGQEPVTVAVARTPGSATEWSTYAIVVARMQRDLGRPVRVRYVPDRSKVIQLFRDRKVDVGFLCTFCYLRLLEEGEVVAVATPVINGVSAEAAVLVVASESPYRSLEDLAGEAVLVSHPNSLGGSAYLHWLLEDSGLDTSHFKEVRRGATQERNLADVLEGEAAATVVNRSQLAAFPAAKFRVVSTSPEFGMPPVVVSASMDPELSEKVSRSLLSVGERGILPEESILDDFRAATIGYSFAERLMDYTREDSE